MDNNRIPESDTSLRFCEYCGSPLFDYGNVCSACGKRQSMQNSVPENGDDNAVSGYGTEASAPVPRVSGLKGTALGGKSDNRQYTDHSINSGYGSANIPRSSGVPTAPDNNTVPLANDPPSSMSGWVAPSNNAPPAGNAPTYNGGTPPSSSRPVAKTDKKGASWILTCIGFFLFAVAAAVAVILFLGYNKEKTQAHLYQRQADSAIAQLSSYEAEKQDSESQLNDYKQQADSYKKQLDDCKKQLSDAQDTIAAKDEEIQIYIDDLYELENLNYDNSRAADFMNSWVVVVFDNGSNIYHKTYCPNFESLYSDYRFWAFNIDAAKDKYYPCSKCID